MATGRVPTTANSPLTAKGDLFGYSTTQARVPVGSDGETLVADSSATTGLRYQTGYNGNAVINGGMDIWQRGTSFTISSVSYYAYTADRWNPVANTSGRTASRQNSGLTGIQYCLRIARDSGNTNTSAIQLAYQLESADSYRFAGQAVTLSFYARAGANYSPTSSILASALVSGTSTDGNVNAGGLTTSVVTGSHTLTTSWQRFQITGTVSSSATQVGFYFTSTPTGTAGAADHYEITGVQLELGSVATTFKRAGNTLAGELAACQRYYQRFTAAVPMLGFASSTTVAQFVMHYKTPMRNTSLTLGQNTMGVWDVGSFFAGGTWGIAASASDSSGISFSRLTYQHGSGVLTQFRPYLAANTDANSWLEVSAEL